MSLFSGLLSIFKKPKPRSFVGVFASKEAMEHDQKVTEPLRKSFEAGYCPDCHGPASEFYSGPQGGMSINIMCSHCESAFNVAVFNGEFITVERIPNHYWNPTVQKGADGKPTEQLKA
jgi:hypothetical protein